MTNSTAPYSVLFDLDGTLLDTAPDLADALNKLLVEEGKTELPFATIRPVVSHGGNALIKLGFGLEPGSKGFTRLRDRFLDIYKENIAARTTLFPGMAELLAFLEERQIPWGVVTNKPSWLTDPLMAKLGLDKRAACVVSGDTAKQAKPHPAPLYYACEKTGHDPEHCIYIGDHQRDIDAGNAAGMLTLVALFGYIDEHDSPEHWLADGLIESPLQTIDYLVKWKALTNS